MDETEQPPLVADPEAGPSRASSSPVDKRENEILVNADDDDDHNDGGMLSHC